MCLIGAPFFIFNTLKIQVVHILQLFMLLAGVIIAFGLYYSVKEFIVETLKDLKDDKF